MPEKGAGRRQLGVAFLVDTDSAGDADEDLLGVPHELVTGLAVGGHVNQLALETVAGMHLKEVGRREWTREVREQKGPHD